MNALNNLKDVVGSLTALAIALIAFGVAAVFGFFAALGFKCLDLVRRKNNFVNIESTMKGSWPLQMPLAI